MAISKIKKFLGLANNLTTTDEGYALDARQGKALNDQIANIHIPAIFIDPTNALLSKTSYVSTEGTYTATENGFLFATQSGKPSTSSMTVKINDTNIAISDSDADYGKGSIACGFIKTGDVVKYKNCVIKIYGLRL